MQLWDRETIIVNPGNISKGFFNVKKLPGVICGFLGITVIHCENCALVTHVALLPKGKFHVCLLDTKD